MATYKDIIDIRLLTKFYSNFIDLGVPFGDWKPQTKYKSGVCIIYDDRLYRCKIAHTSSNVFNDSNWTPLSGASGDAITLATNEDIDKIFA